MSFNRDTSIYLLIEKWILSKTNATSPTTPTAPDRATELMHIAFASYYLFSLSLARTRLDQSPYSTVLRYNENSLCVII